MVKIVKNNVHYHKLECVLGWPELNVLISDAVYQAAGMLQEPGDKITVQILQTTEGSPPYNIQQWSAHVTVVRNIELK